MANASKFRFENLDSIRTIAFFSTFLAHAFYAESPEILESDAFQIAVGFRQIFSFGVPIFFVLSGFLITYLMLREQHLIGKFSLKDFYMRRVLRIWPLFYLVLIFGFVVFPLVRTFILHDPYIETADWRMYFTFLSNFDQINQPQLPYGVGLGPTWSVSIEEQYYLMWPILLLFFKRRKFILPILLVVISSLFFTSFFSLSNKHTVFCMTYLAVGAGAAYLAYYYESFIRKITNVNGAFFLLAIAALFGLIYASTKGYGNIFVIFFIASLISYIIVYQCYANRMTLKSIPFLERWGKYTYGLYLYHVICNFIIHMLIDKIAGIPESLSMALFVKPFLSLILSMIVSFYSYHYFERFFLSLKKKFTPTVSE